MKILSINGPIIKADNDGSIRMREMVKVGDLGLIGEVIELQQEHAVIQVYEDTTGVKVNEKVDALKYPLSVTLGPGLLGGIFDGIGRPLKKFSENGFIERGLYPFPLDEDKRYDFITDMKKGDAVSEGMHLGHIIEMSLKHYIMVPPGVTGIIGDIFPGKRKVEDIFCTIELDHGEPLEIRGFHKWPVRKKRPVNERLSMNEPFFTGQRVLDFLFPIPRGGVAAVPGGFGAGKTVLQHSIAKWSNADIIIYVGCGERGNEIAQILEEFPTLKDPRSGRSLMERTIIIANTSNMPVTARESSIYTGITMAEYYRDMGYNVTILADSTSRWAEALRELSSRLEEIPAEEGYPAYLASRLAEYYERAGSFKTLSGKTGSITAIGAVSPQGADFSEPVTQHTKRFVRSFWALDKSLASAKHFPAVSWKISYSEYGEEVVDWWKLNANVDWDSMRTTLAETLQDADKLENIIKIVGFESLPDREKLTVLSSNLIKKGFLQQNSYDPVDSFCLPEKQVKIAQALIYFHSRSAEMMNEGDSFNKINKSEAIDKIQRLKFIPFPSAEFDSTLDEINTELEGKQ
ncbi:V-type ATP synthase subunit A [bacterium]|nr:V-type ATP synthase subunit A [bacterium]